MKINWKVRFSNPVFYGQIVLSVLTPILAYLGISGADITTWAKLGEVLLLAVSNPYVLVSVVVSVYNSLIDPTTVGVGDSRIALTYNIPNK